MSTKVRIAKVDVDALLSHCPKEFLEQREVFIAGGLVMHMLVIEFLVEASELMLTKHREMEKDSKYGKDYASNLHAGVVTIEGLMLELTGGTFPQFSEEYLSNIN